MRQFTSAPAIPVGYTRLRLALSADEVALAYQHSYVADTVDPSALVNRSGYDYSFNPPAEDDVKDWRTRIFLVWFCYVYENLRALKEPMGAIEELILEFQAPEILDPPGARLATYYAGAAARDPISTQELEQEVKYLAPHYRNALLLLGNLRI
jgi:hypothetical protein